MQKPIFWFKSSWRVRSLMAVVLACAAQWPATAPAQNRTGFDVFQCAQSQEVATLAQMKMCMAHTGCDLVLQAFQACAPAMQFLSRIRSGQPGATGITSNDVFDAAAPELTHSEPLRRRITSVRQLVADAAQLPDHTRLEKRERGHFAYYEGGVKDGQPHGIGVFIVDNGSMMRGQFVNGRLNGLGQMQSLGSMLVNVGEFQNFQLHGLGAFQNSIGVVYAGRFDNSRMTGLIEEIDAQGYSRKTLHDEKGRILAQGERAPPGRAAQAPRMASLAPDKMPSLELINECRRRYFESSWERLKRPSEQWNGAAKARSAIALRELYEGRCMHVSDAGEKLAEAERLSREAEQEARIEAASDARDRAQAAQVVLAILGAVAGAVIDNRQARRAAPAISSSAAIEPRGAPEPGPVQGARQDTPSASGAIENNAGGDATHCLQVIDEAKMKTMGIRSITTKGFLNQCTFPVIAVYCYVGRDCNPGYTNLSDTIQPGRFYGLAGGGRTGTIAHGACRAGPGYGFGRGNAAANKELKHVCN